jgi:hypothetical protein
VENNLSTFPDGLYQFGGSPVGPAASVIAAGGKWLWVDPANGNDAYDGTSPKWAMKSVIAAEDALTGDKNEGIFLVGGSTADTITSALTWDKNYTHLIGLCPPTMYGIRNRILSTGAALSPLVTISGNGCVFQNFMISHEGTVSSAAAAIACTVSGSRNYFGNVTFRQVGALTVLETTKRDIKLNSSDGENYFYKCTFGSDSYDGSANAANYNMELTASAQSARNVFDECLWLGSGSSGAGFIIAGASATTSLTWFKRCMFFNNQLGTMNEMAQGFSIAAGNGYFIMQDCLLYGAGALETTDSLLIVKNHVNAAATGLLGIVATA